MIESTDIESTDGISAMRWRILTRIAPGPVFGAAGSLVAQNRHFHGTGGRSQENRSRGFRPAFLDTLSGTIHLSRFADGRIAPVHLLEGLPRELIRQRSTGGRPIAMNRRLIAGFERDSRFYTRAQAAATIDSPVCVP